MWQEVALFSKSPTPAPRGKNSAEPTSAQLVATKRVTKWNHPHRGCFIGYLRAAKIGLKPGRNRLFPPLCRAAPRRERKNRGRARVVAFQGPDRADLLRASSPPAFAPNELGIKNGFLRACMGVSCPLVRIPQVMLGIKHDGSPRRPDVPRNEQEPVAEEIFGDGLLWITVVDGSADTRPRATILP